MLGNNVDELQKLVDAARTWRAAGLALVPTPVTITQINSRIEGRAVVLAWSDEDNDWEVTAS